MKEPESMEELVYFTRRSNDNGKIMAWVFREKCTECKDAMMGKPVEKGKVKTRSSEYVCPSCGHTVPKEEYEDTLTCCIKYTCPHCDHKGEAEVPFKWKTYKGVKSVLFECGSCKEKLAVTKKMKEPKK